MLHTRTSRLAASAVGLAALTGGLIAQPAAAGPTAGTASAEVFFINPVQSTGDQSLTDEKDASSGFPAKAYVPVTLTDLDGSGYLVGRWANIRSETGDRAFAAPKRQLRLRPLRRPVRAGDGLLLSRRRRSTSRAWGSAPVSCAR